MSLQPRVDDGVPDSTAWVAKAAFPKGTLCLQPYDLLGTRFQEQDFTMWFPRRGQRESALRLAQQWDRLSPEGQVAIQAAIQSRLPPAKG